MPTVCIRLLNQNAHFLNFVLAAAARRPRSSGGLLDPVLGRERWQAWPHVTAGVIGSSPPGLQGPWRIDDPDIGT